MSRGQDHYGQTIITIGKTCAGCGVVIPVGKSALVDADGHYYHEGWIVDRCAATGGPKHDRPRESMTDEELEADVSEALEQLDSPTLAELLKRWKAVRSALDEPAAMVALSGLTQSTIEGWSDSRIMAEAKAAGAVEEPYDWRFVAELGARFAKLVETAADRLEAVEPETTAPPEAMKTNDVSVYRVEPKAVGTELQPHWVKYLAVPGGWLVELIYPNAPRAGMRPMFVPRSAAVDPRDFAIALADLLSQAADKYGNLENNFGTAIRTIRRAWESTT